MKRKQDIRAKKNRNKLIGIVGIVLMGIAGICLMAYPWVSQYCTQWKQNLSVRDYVTGIEKQEDGSLTQWLEEARDYNRRLWSFYSEIRNGQEAREDELAGLTGDYPSLLNPNRNGIMGTISIPKLSILLPIYHGTDEETLSRGAGHLENTSLPIGGIHTHTVLSAHTGYPGAAMFDRLVELEEGDLFSIRVLDQILVYRVTAITIASPYDFTGLMIREGEDLCTLVTCYPYGINSHRLLVTGTRVEDPETEEIQVPTEEKTGSFWVWPAAGGGVFLLLILGVFLRRRKRRLKWKRPFPEEF